MDANQAARLEVGRRIKAARAYAGLTSQQELAKKIASLGYSRGYKRDVIAGWEVGGYKHALGRDKLRTIAEACDLPYEFFTADFSRLGEISSPGAQVEQELEEAAAPSPRRAGSNGSAGRAPRKATR